MRRLLSTTVVLAALTTPAKADTGCHSSQCAERVARKQCGQRRPRACVDRAILTYRLSGWQSAWMRRVPGCESGWNPWATSPGGHMGLYQFAAGTWAGLRYRRHSAYVAKWAALGAALMVREGRTGEWSCR